MREKLIEAKRKRIKRWLAGFVVLLFVCIVIYLRFFLPSWFKQLSFFKVKNIVVEPQAHSSFIKAYISIPESTSILYLDLGDIYKKIKQVYFIEDCSIEKHLPDTIFIKLKVRTPWVVVSDAKRAVLMDKQGFFLPLQENFRAWNIVGMDPGEIGKQTTEIEKLNILKEIEQWYNYYGIGNIFSVNTILIEDIDRIILTNSEGCVYIRGDGIQSQIETLKKVLVNCKKNNFQFEYIDMRFDQPYVKNKDVNTQPDVSAKGKIEKN